MASVEIRPHRPQDAEALGVVFRSAILDSKTHYSAEQRHAWARDANWNADTWEARMAGLSPWVATDGKQVLGYADLQPDGLIDHFFVSTQRHGVGTALMRHILTLARVNKLPELHSHVSRNAQGFYARFGFMPHRFKVVEVGGVNTDYTELRLTTSQARMSLKAHASPPVFELVPCQATDFEAVLALRLQAMRPSLEALGRFSPERARERLVATFEPQHAQHVVADGQRVGFVTVKPHGSSAWELVHLYVLPSHQGLGLGAAVLGGVISHADAQGAHVGVEVLQSSKALSFYLRHGFVCTGQSEWDWRMSRPPAGFALI